MADDDDQSSKTHDPTERRLKQLRDEGNVPYSKEVSNLFAVLGMIAIAGLAGPWACGQLLEAGAGVLANSGDIILEDSASIGAAMSGISLTLVLSLLPLMIIFLILGYVSSWAQNGGIFSSKPLEPTLSKISPVEGFKRMFGLKSLVELLKSTIKIIVIGGAMAWVMWDRRDTLIGLLMVTLF